MSYKGIIVDLTKLSIKHKFTISLVIAVLTSTLLVGAFSQWKARSLVSERVEQVELPNTLMRIRNDIDKEITLMQGITEQLAQNTFVEHWLQNGADKAGEQQVIDYLGRLSHRYNLSNVSVANRESADYWNQDGFLRTLQNDNLDGWFFAFKDSGEALSRSLYTESGVTKLFVNFQQLDGKVLAGIARTMDAMVNMLNGNKIADTGFVFVTDSQGKVMLHRNASLLNKADLNSLYGSNGSLLGKQDFAVEHVSIDGEPYYIASSYLETADWYVVAQVPEGEVFAQLDSARNQMIFWSLVIAAAIAVFAFTISSHLTRPISELAQVFTRLGQAEANLDVRLNSQTSSELSELQNGFNGFVSKIQKTVEQVATSSDSLKREADNVTEAAKISLKQGQLQSEHLERVAAAVSEMDATVSDVEANANFASKTADDLETTSLSGKEVIIHARESMTSLSRHVDEVSQVITDLASNTEAIGSVLEVIRGVSEQTNLLALNAAIEAARAGEHGRGFAVVADEVRTLAQRTNESTDEIQQTINKLQGEASKAVSMISESNRQANDGVESVEKAEVALTSIADTVTKMRDTNSVVAHSTEQQASVAHEIHSNLSEMQVEGSNSLKAAEQVADASKELQRLAELMDKLVVSYR